MTKIFSLLIIFLSSTNIYSQDVAIKLVVKQIEVRSKENGRWTEWTKMQDSNKKKMYLVIDNTAKSVTWEIENDKKEIEITSYQIIAQKEDNSFADFKVDCLILELKKQDVNSTITYKLCFLNCGQCISYRIITNADDKSNLQFRYLLSEDKM